MRATEYIHYSIIERFSNELLELPFFVQKWHPNLAKYGKRAGLESTPVKQSKEFPAFSTWQQQFNTSREMRQTTADLMAHHGDSELWRYVDRVKLVKQLGNQKFSNMELHSLFGILGVFFKSQHIEIPRKLWNQNREINEPVSIQLVSKSNGMNNYVPYHADSNYEVSESAGVFKTHSYAIDLLNGQIFKKPTITRSLARWIDSPMKLWRLVLVRYS